MSDYEHIGNKRQKEHGLIVVITRSINSYIKRINISRILFAKMLGISSEGYLLNKLKRTREDADLTTTELIHTMEITKDHSPLKYLAEMFGYVLVKIEAEENISIEQLNQIIDDAQIESNESFSASKIALRDNKISTEEKENMLKTEYRTIEKHHEKIEAIRKIKPYDLEEDEDE